MAPFSEVYQKAFKSPLQFQGKRWNFHQDAEGQEVGIGLPSKELRALLIKGLSVEQQGEYERRHELEEIINDFPKLND